MPFILLPAGAYAPPMLPDTDPFYRNDWTHQPGEPLPLHVSVIGAAPVEAQAIVPVTSHSIALRQYQLEAVQAVHRAWEEGIKAPLVVLPCGVGKTIIGAQLLSDAHTQGARSIFLAHRTELLEQTLGKLRLVTASSAHPPQLGLVQGSANDTGRDITVASIQTLGHKSGKRLRELLESGSFDRIICDEAHHAVSPTWKRVLDGMLEARPSALLLGLTATPGRADGTALDSIFSDVVFYRNTLEMVEQGYLVPPRGFEVRLDIDLDRVAMDDANGDFSRTSLGRLMNQPEVNATVIKAWRDHAIGRKTMVFAVNVEHSKALTDGFNGIGWTAEHVDGTTKAGERKAILKRFRTGQTQILCNCEVGTEGFDDPSIACILLARPTKSQVLYIQSVGRGLRPYPAKHECLVIDCVGNSSKHSLAQLATVTGFDSSRRGVGNGEVVPRDVKEVFVRSVSSTVREFQFTATTGQSRYNWRESAIGWTLQVPRIGYYLLAWDDKDHTKVSIRFYDQRPGKSDSLPRQVIREPVPFDLGYGLVETEMERILQARTTRRTAYTKEGVPFESNRENEFHAEQETLAPPEISMIDLDEGLDEELAVPEVLMVKGANWRTKPITDRQRDLLQKLKHKEKSLPPTAGEAADLITILRVERDAKLREPATEKQLNYLRRHGLPLVQTKGAAARAIWEHRKETHA